MVRAQDFGDWLTTWYTSAHEYDLIGLRSSVRSLNRKTDTERKVEFRIRVRIIGR